MKLIIPALALFIASVTGAQANSIPAFMVHAKTLQNPSALAGAAEVCMSVYFDGLRAAAEECRAEAATKTLPGAEFAACQATLILGYVIRSIRAATKQAICPARIPTLSLASAPGLNLDNLNWPSKRRLRVGTTQGPFGGLAEAAARAACEAAGL